ncbi:MAG: hypothetical protein KAT48_14205 [Bacteroidales bacterium]|nr:hypothetical protein [Bacteroidales bacterium]
MIYNYFGAPKNGKTYTMVEKIIKALKRDKRKVFTNFPVFYKDKTTYKWLPEMVTWDIFDSDIYIDEAYIDYSSREFKKFSMDQHTFFSMNGHNGDDIILATHHPARLDTIIREMVNMFYYVKKTAWPLSERAIFFTIEGYQTELALSQRYSNPNAIYTKHRLLAKKSVYKAYDYHYFRKPGVERKDFELWPSPDIDGTDILYNMTQDEVQGFNAGNVDLGDEGSLSIELVDPVPEIHQ